MYKREGLSYIPSTEQNQVNAQAPPHFPTGEVTQSGLGEQFFRQLHANPLPRSYGELPNHQEHPIDVFNFVPPPPELPLATASGLFYQNTLPKNTELQPIFTPSEPRFWNESYMSHESPQALFNISEGKLQPNSYMVYYETERSAPNLLNQSRSKRQGDYSSEPKTGPSEGYEPNIMSLSRSMFHLSDSEEVDISKVNKSELAKYYTFPDGEVITKKVVKAAIQVRGHMINKKKLKRRNNNKKEGLIDTRGYVKRNKSYGWLRKHLKKHEDDADVSNLIDEEIRSDLGLPNDGQITKKVMSEALDKKVKSNKLDNVRRSRLKKYIRAQNPNSEVTTQAKARVVEIFKLSESEIPDKYKKLLKLINTPLVATGSAGIEGNNTNNQGEESGSE